MYGSGFNTVLLYHKFTTSDKKEPPCFLHFLQLFDIFSIFLQSSWSCILYHFIKILFKILVQCKFQSFGPWFSTWFSIRRFSFSIKVENSSVSRTVHGFIPRYKKRTGLEKYCKLIDSSIKCLGISPKEPIEMKTRKVCLMYPIFSPLPSNEQS